MSTVAAQPAVGDTPIRTVLRPARTAVSASPATVVVVDHDPVANVGLAGSHGVTDELDDSTRLMPFDHQLRSGAQRAVKVMEVAPAHTGGLHADDHFIRPGHRVGILTNIEPILAQEDDSFHI